MSMSQSQKKEAIAQAAEQELASLAGRGVRIAGNACSPIVLVKGDLDEAERSGGELAAGPDGAALRKALGAIGYAPEDFCVLASVAGVGDGAVAVGETLPCELSARRSRLWTPRQSCCWTIARPIPCARPMPTCLWQSTTSIPLCSSPAWSPMCRAAACSRSTALRRGTHRQGRQAAHVGIHQAADPGSRSAVADWRW